MPRRLPTLLFVAVLAPALLGACSKDDDGDRRAAAPATAPTTTVPPGPPTVAVTVAGVDPQGTKAPDEATVAAVKATIDRWLATAVVGPLFSGQAAGDLSAVFTPAALERLTADPAARATLVDEGMPPASTAITADLATVNLSSVAGPDGVVGVIVAQFDVKLHAVGPTIDVDVHHFGEVVLVPEAHGWMIDSFDVAAARDSRQA